MTIIPQNELTVHGFKSMRRRAAIERNSKLMFSLKLRVAHLEHELHKWEHWYHRWDYNGGHGADWNACDNPANAKLFNDLDAYSKFQCSDSSWQACVDHWGCGNHGDSIQRCGPAAGSRSVDARSVGSGPVVGARIGGDNLQLDNGSCDDRLSREVHSSSSGSGSGGSLQHSTRHRKSRSLRSEVHRRNALDCSNEEDGMFLGAALDIDGSFDGDSGSSSPGGLRNTQCLCGELQIEAVNDSHGSRGSDVGQQQQPQQQQRQQCLASRSNSQGREVEDLIGSHVQEDDNVNGDGSDSGIQSRSHTPLDLQCCDQRGVSCRNSGDAEQSIQISPTSSDPDARSSGSGGGQDLSQSRDAFVHAAIGTHGDSAVHESSHAGSSGDVDGSRLQSGDGGGGSDVGQQQQPQQQQRQQCLASRSNLQGREVEDLIGSHVREDDNANGDGSDSGIQSRSHTHLDLQRCDQRGVSCRNSGDAEQSIQISPTSSDPDARSSGSGGGQDLSQIRDAFVHAAIGAHGDSAVHESLHEGSSGDVVGSSLQSGDGGGGSAVVGGGSLDEVEQKIASALWQRLDQDMEWLAQHKRIDLAGCGDLFLSELKTDICTIVVKSAVLRPCLLKQDCVTMLSYMVGRLAAGLKSDLRACPAGKREGTYKSALQRRVDAIIIPELLNMMQ